MPRTFQMPPERGVRPASRPSIRSARTEAVKPRNIHFSTRESRAVLTEGMTYGEIAKSLAVSALFVLAGCAALWTLGFFIGHFLKGWW